MISSDLVNLLNKPVSILALSLTLGLASCGGGGDSAPASGVTPDQPEQLDEPVETQSITGGGVKGPLANAVVTVYVFDASKAGFKGAAAGTGSTDASAAITGLALPFPLNPPYIMEFTSTPGTTTDITTGAYPVITTMRTVITQAAIDAGEQIYATPLTTMAVDIAVANANAGAGTGTSSAQFEAALTTAAAQVVSTLGFGMDSSVNIFDTPPLVDNTTDTTSEQTSVAAYRAAVEAVTAIAYQMDQQTAGGTTDSVLSALAADLADGGGIDGSTGSTEITTDTLQILQQDPAKLPIPNSPTNQTVADVQAILVEETATTGTTTSTTELDEGGSITTEPAPAETNPDIDADGVLNADDAYPNDATADTDTDGDGAPDTAWTDASRATVDTARSDADDDNDGWLDIEDDYTTDVTRFLDPALDRDVDTIANGTDNCPLTSNTDQLDTDANGQGDACSNDNDGDGVDDGVDNCPLVANPSQTDTGGSADGDACDINIDGDSADNDVDAFPYDPTETIDTDGDGIGNTADTDDDNDGVLDGADTGFAPVGAPSEGVACSLLRDCDGDGVLDAADYNPVDKNVTFNFSPIAANSSVTTDEDVAASAVLDVTDDGVAAGALVYAITSGPANGALSGTEPNLTYTPAANFSGSDSFSFTATDAGGKVSAEATVSITVTAVNDTPVAADDAASTNEDTAITTADVRANDSDVEGDALTATLLVNASNGNAVDNGDGTFTYTPNANYNGADSFTYTLSDGNGGSATATVSITVNAINDAPVANTDSVVTDEDTAVITADVRANDSDTELDALTATLLANASNGNVVDNANGTFTYTPNADYNGTDSFTYTLSDGNGGSATATVNITVNAINDAPVANDDAATTDEDTAVTTVDVTANDTDLADGDPLTATLLVNASNGNVVDNGNGTFTYTPNANYNGADSFTYTLSDGNGGSATATVNITVNTINDTPVANTDSATTDEDTAVTTVDVRLNDSDTELDALTATLLANASNGNVVDNANGTFTYTPNANYNGADSFTYTLSDGNGGSATATVNITVNAINDAPVGNTDAFSAGVLTATPLNVLSNDTDIDLDTLTITAVTQGSLGSTVVNNGFNITFTDVNNAEGTETFTYDLFDGTTTVSGILVTVTVTANVPPVATADSATTDEDNSVQIVNVLGNDTDGGDGPNALSVFSVDTVSANGGTVTNVGGGTFDYIPAQDFNGEDTFSYTVSDGLDTSAGTVTITVTPVNDDPEVLGESDTTDEDTQFTTINVLANDTDVDGDTLTASLLNNAIDGNVVDNGDGTFTYTPDTDYNGVDGFSYLVSDGLTSIEGFFDITVTAVNDAPVATDDTETATVDVALITGNVLSNDTDPDLDSLTITTFDATSTSGGTVVDNSNGTFIYTSAAGYTGSDSFTYTVSDGFLTSTATVNVTVISAGTPIPMTTLMDATNGGVAGFEMDGPTGFEYWTDNFDAGTGVFDFNDYEYNYASEAFQLSAGGYELKWNGASWVAEDHIVGADDGIGGINLSIRDVTDAEVGSYNLTAKYVDISGQTIITYLNDPEWKAAMVDQAAVFSSGAKLISEYRFEALSDSYSLWVDDWCIDNGTQYTDLNGNCNSIYVGTTATGFAETLAQVVQGTAWSDIDDGSTPSVTQWVAGNDANNTNLQVEFVTGNVANYYMIDWNTSVPADTAVLVATGSWIQDSSSGVEMIHYEVPAAAASLFADDLGDGLNFFLTVQNGFVRPGGKDTIGSAFFENGMLNGVAKDDILANFDAIQAIGYNNVDLTLTTGYDLYYDSGLSSWCLDYYNFNGDGTFTGGDYGSFACDGVNVAGTFFGTYSVDSATGIMTISDGVDTWYRQVNGVSTTYGAKEVCSSLTVPGTLDTCVQGDDMFGFEFDDSNAASYALGVLNSVANLDCTYETPWGAGQPDPFNSFDDFQTVLTNCGGVLPITSTDAEGTWVESYWNGSADETEVLVLNNGGTGDFYGYVDGVLTDTGSFSWSVSNNFITITDGSTFMDVWALTSQGIKAYTEETSWGSDVSIVSTSTLDGEIWTGGYHKAGTCGYESGWDNGDPGAPIVPNSFAEFESGVADCDAASDGVEAVVFTAAQIEGLVTSESPEVTTFNALGGALGTEASPGTGTYDENGDGSGFVMTFNWWVEPATCSGCTHSYVVIYSDTSIDADLNAIGAGFWVRETSALVGVNGVDGGTPGDELIFYKYAEQQNYSDTDRATASDGEIWLSTGNIVQ